MNDFFKFPSTVHLTAVSSVSRLDKVMNRVEQVEFLSKALVAEEKLDGANIGISKSPAGEIRVQNRGGYIAEPYSGQFSRLSSWMSLHSGGLNIALKDRVILFGEWCAAKHSIEYSALPDLFLLFDVYDLDERKFWSTTRRNSLASRAELHVVPSVKLAEISISSIHEILELEHSKFSKEKMEGIILRQDSHLWNNSRAKLVRNDFTQSIDDHWSKRFIVWNKLS